MVALVLWQAVAWSTPPRPPAQSGGQQQPPPRTVRISAERFSFTPSRIKARAGEHLEILVSSEDTYHGFRIAGATVDGLVPPRGRGELKVRLHVREAGSFVFECSRPCGAGHTMMRGVIIVEED